jgi:hypothetical protein
MTGATFGLASLYAGMIGGRVQRPDQFKFPVDHALRHRPKSVSK